MIKKIKDMQIGESAEIVKYESHGDKMYRSKILSMGLTKGTVIKLLKKAPFGDPVEIEVRGFNLTLRKNEADMILVKGVTDEKDSSGR